MKLYTNPRSRGVRAHWTLEELGVPYEVQFLDFTKGETHTPEYEKIHPFGQLPALVLDDGQPVIESGAICAFLAEKYPEKGLGPGDQAAEWHQWNFYTFGSLEPPLANYLAHAHYLPEEQRVASVAESSLATLKKVLTHFNGHMADREWVLGKRFSVADILAGGTVQWGAMTLPLDDYPHLQSYVQRLNSRPAFQRIMQPS